VQQNDTPAPVLIYVLPLPVQLGNTSFQIYKLDKPGSKQYLTAQNNSQILCNNIMNPIGNIIYTVSVFLNKL
jgi:hypothetical protein